MIGPGQLQLQDSRFKGIRDFRRTVATFVDGVRIAEENVQPEDRFVLFDLGGREFARANHRRQPVISCHLLRPAVDGENARARLSSLPYRA